MTTRVFITGTDTDVGKTFVASILLHKAQQSGLSCFGLKPIAAGCERLDGQLKNDDALALQAASRPQADYSVHNPIALEAAIAPHIAFQQTQQTELSLEALTQACEPGLSQAVDFHLTEGAGGWLVPINNKHTLADFAKPLDVEVILVVGLKLGCINHALLSVQGIQSSGMKLKGWIANRIDPEMSHAAENIEYLKQAIEAPCLGDVPFSPQQNAVELSHHIDAAALLAPTPN